MRNLRLFVVLALSAAPLTTWITGCGGDDSSGGSSGTPDSSTGTSSSSSGSTSTDSSTPDSAPSGPTANATSVSVYMGSVARLDGSASTGSALTYAWTVKTVPAGSAIATASLAGANTAVTTFTPDKIGAYELELTVTEGSQTSKTTATATVIDPPVFYFDSNTIDGGFAARLLVTGATAGDGGAGKPVACFERDSGVYTVQRNASAGTDWWEAPAGQPSKTAFIMETLVDGGQAATLFATTSNGSCATAPTKLDYVPLPAGSNHTFEQPRISPDGNRVAYVRAGAEGTRVVTIGLDGQNQRVLGARFAEADGGANPEAGLTDGPYSRPFWQGNTHVAWIETLATDSWQVVRAADAANGTREVLAQCSSPIPSQAELLPNGDILVAQGVSGGSALVAYPIVAATKTCGTARPITPLPDGAALEAVDFQLSPDGKEVAYLATGDGFFRQAFITKIDGTSAPRRAADIGTAQRGPRWVGNGSFVSWGTIQGGAIDAGVDSGGIVVASADGGGSPEAGPKPINVPVQDNAATSIGNGIFSCSMGNAAGSGVAFAGFAGLAMLRLVRRRRR